MKSQLEQDYNIIHGGFQSASSNLDTNRRASSPAVAMLLGITCTGTAAIF